MKEQINRSAVDDIMYLNGGFTDIFKGVSNDVSGRSFINDGILNQLEDDIDNILFDEIETVTNFTGDEISTYLTKLYNGHDAGGDIGFRKDIDGLFQADNTQIVQLFQDRYKNRFFLYDDLATISSQLNELEEAINTMRDSICTSDDLSVGISRSLSFKSLTDKDKQSNSTIVEQIEQSMGIENKIRNHIIPNTLTYGSYYVYTIPYSHMMQKFQARSKPSNPNKANIMQESSIPAAIALESLVPEFKDEMLDDAGKKAKTTNDIILESIMSEVENNQSLSGKFSKKDVTSCYNNIASHIGIYDENMEIPIPLVENSVTASELNMIKDNSSWDKLVSKARKQNTDRSNKSLYNDGTVDYSNVDATKGDDFSDIKGCYVKLCSPKSVIPIKILNNTTIGYYYILEDTNVILKKPVAGNRATSINYAALNATANDFQDLEKIIVSKVSDRIVRAFNKKHLEENSKFRNLIVDALTFNDMYRKNVKFMFIPAEYMTEFKVNEDEDGNGQSMLKNSLFYAKLYLALLLFKMITIITKSNDTRVNYIKNGSIDKDIANKVQDVARSLKAKQINFKDLLTDYNSLVTKIGASKELFVPVTKSGERSMEFDVIAGQDVQLDSDLMEKLRTNFINSTGVPSVIMNYVNEADYAKTLVMANSKFLGRVINYQQSFNKYLTEMMQKILLYSTEIDPVDIFHFRYELNSPKTLNTMNFAEATSNIEQNIQFLLDNTMGKDSDPSDEDRLVKDIANKHLMGEYIPSLAKETVEKAVARARIEAKLELERRRALKSGSEETEM